MKLPNPGSVVFVSFMALGSARASSTSPTPLQVKAACSGSAVQGQEKFRVEVNLFAREDESDCTTSNDRNVQSLQCPGSVYLKVSSVDASGKEVLKLMDLVPNVSFVRSYFYSNAPTVVTLSTSFVGSLPGAIKWNVKDKAGTLESGEGADKKLVALDCQQ